jgi:hypothetical protein
MYSNSDLEQNTEDAETIATKRAVNEAARETPDSDTDAAAAPFAHGCDDLTLADGEPDISIQIDCDESKSRYLYQMVDSGTSLSHMATGTILGADANGLRLYAVMASLESVLRGRILERLVSRYGYRTKASALASRRQLIVTIASTDPELIEAGTIITEAIEADALPFLSPSPAREAWQAVTPQLERFNVVWELIPAGTPILANLRVWAEAVMTDCPHSGPVYSPARKVAA